MKAQRSTDSTTKYVIPGSLHCLFVWRLSYANRLKKSRIYSAYFYSPMRYYDLCNYVLTEPSGKKTQEKYQLVMERESLASVECIVFWR